MMVLRYLGDRCKKMKRLNLMYSSGQMMFNKSYMEGVEGRKKKLHEADLSN